MTILFYIEKKQKIQYLFTIETSYLSRNQHEPKLIMIMY